nr:hypothetical protein [uncultured Noviherbaspirillum sp.]
MSNNTRAPARFTLCTTMALLSSPAFAHDGPHQLTYLQALLHDLAYADYLPAGLALTAAVAAVSWRLARRKASRTKL